MNVRHHALIDPCYSSNIHPTMSNPQYSNAAIPYYTMLSNADVYFCLPMSSSLSTNMLFLSGLADDFAER